MSGSKTTSIIRQSALAVTLLFGASQVQANDNTGAAMRAGVIVKEMPVRERMTYVLGLVDALAYQRFRKDTDANGQADYSGMDCIVQWFSNDMVSQMRSIDAAFKKYADHSPAMILTAMVKKECDE